MAAADQPSVLLSHVHRADGSATFSQNGYTVIGAVNGPVEVTRRDEIPEEAALDISVRPVTGIGGIRERHLEMILQATLRHVILIQEFPRTSIQITLHVIAIPEDDSGVKMGQSDSILPILPALLQSAILALLSASMPMAKTSSAVLVAITNSAFANEVKCNPSLDDIRSANSLHVLAFSSQGELIVDESEGSFDMDQWDDVFDRAKLYCGDLVGSDDGSGGNNASSDNMTSFLNSTLRKKISADLRWKSQHG